MLAFNNIHFIDPRESTGSDAWVAWDCGGRPTTRRHLEDAEVPREEDGIFDKMLDRILTKVGLTH